MSFLTERFRAIFFRLFSRARIAEKVRIGRRFHASYLKGIILSRRSRVADNVTININSKNAILRVEEYAYIGEHVQMDIIERVVVHKHALIAPFVYITDHNHGISKNARIDQQQCAGSAVEIGEDSWVGAKSIILKGVCIGQGAVVGAGSVVTKSVEPYTIVAGVPAKKIGQRMR